MRCPRGARYTRASLLSFPASFSFLFWFPGMRETLTPSFVSQVAVGRPFGQANFEVRRTAETKILPFNELLIVSHDDIKRRSRVRSVSRRPGPSSRSSEVLGDQDSGSGALGECYRQFPGFRIPCPFLGSRKNSVDMCCPPFHCSPNIPALTE